MAAGLTLLVGGLLLGFTDITRVGVLLAALPLLAALNARRGNNVFLVTRTAHPDRLVVGQVATVAVVLQNTSGRHTPLLLAEEGVHLPLGDRPRVILPPMVPGDVQKVEYPVRSQVRGRFRLGPMTLRRQDPYGLATITTALPGSSEILVLPRVEVLGSGRPRAGGVGTEGAIPHMIALHGEDDVAVRTYRDGDDLRRIHWPATAHRNTLMVRQEDRPARRRAVIVLDSRTAGHQGSGPLGSFEWSVTAAASVAAHLFDHRYALHLVSNEAITEGTAAETVEIDDALAALAMAQPGTSRQFDEVLHWAQPLTSAGGLVVALVTDHDESVVRRIAALRQPEGNGLLFLLDSASFGPARAQAPAGRAQAPAGRAPALAGLVAEAGWSTCVVTSGMSVASAWDAVSASSPVAFGAER